MNKSELIERLALDCDISKTKAELVINTLVGTVSELLCSGEKLTLTGFGTFYVSDRPAREGRNPQTGYKISIPATSVPRFTPGVQLKKAVNPEVLRSASSYQAEKAQKAAKAASATKRTPAAAQAAAPGSKGVKSTVKSAGTKSGSGKSKRV